MLFYSQNRSEKFSDHVWFHITSELISLYPLLLVILDLDAGQEMQNFPSRVGTVLNSKLLKSGQIKMNKSVKEVPKKLKINPYLSDNQWEISNL